MIMIIIIPILIFLYLDIYIYNKEKELNIINNIISKFSSASSNFNVSNDDNNETITLNFYNYSLLFTTNIINEFISFNDIYYIYHNNSHHISHKRLFYNSAINEITNPSVLYKKNSYDELYYFLDNYNDKKAKFIYIELVVYVITINKKLKSYKTIKTTFYIKRNIMYKDLFLYFFKTLIKDSKYKFTIPNDSSLIFNNNNNNENDQQFKIIDYYNSDIDNTNQLEYTHKTIDEYNDFYYS